MALVRNQNPTQNKRQSACRIRQNWRRKTIAFGSGASQFESDNDTEDDIQRMVHSTTINDERERGDRRLSFSKAAILAAPFAAPPDGFNPSATHVGSGEVPGADEACIRTPSVVWNPRHTGSVQSRVCNFEALLRRSNSCDAKSAKVALSPPALIPPFRHASNTNIEQVEKSLFKTLVQRRVVQQEDIATPDGPLKPIVSSTMPPKLRHLHRSWIGDPGGKYHHRRSVPAAFAMAVDEPSEHSRISGEIQPCWTPVNNKIGDYPASESVSRKKQVFEELMMQQSQTTTPSPPPSSGRLLRKSRSDAGVHLMKTLAQVEDVTPMEAPKSKVMARKPCFVAHPVLHTRLSFDNKPEPEMTVTSASCNAKPDLQPNVFQRGSLHRMSLERFRQMSEKFTLTDINRRFPFVTKETTFEATLTKNSRGLGIGICGGYDHDTPDSSSEKDPLDALVRVKRLFPLQPALLSGKLQPGDVLLAVNGRPLTGLANYEAIDALRVAPCEVTLTVCRPPIGTLPPVPQAGNLSSSSLLSLSSMSLTGLQTEEAFRPTPALEEFEMRLVKVNGSLGFTIHKKEDHIIGHFVKSLVKDPALTDGRLQPGDLIAKVNGTDISSFSHLEAIAFLRNSAKEVDLLVRRGVETPLSPLSPLNQTRTFPRTKVEMKRKMLRKEARDLLSDKIGKKNSTDSTSTRRNPFLTSPRARRKRLEEEVNKDGKTDIEANYIQDDELRLKKTTSPRREFFDDTIDLTSSSTLATKTSKIFPQRPSSLDLSLPEFPTLSRRLNGPVSMSPIPAVCVTRWNSGDQSSDTESSATTNNEVDFKTADTRESEGRDLMSSSTDELYLTPPQSPLVSTEPNPNLKASVFHEASAFSKLHDFPNLETVNGAQHARHIFTVDLQRTIGSRLGFSLTTAGTPCLNPDICIKAVFPGTLADADGRIKVGDMLLQINDKSLSGMAVEDAVQILRDIKGTVSLILAREVS